MTDPDAQIVFDFIDPLSYLMELELQRMPRTLAPSTRHVGFELRPPPAPLTAVDDPIWAERWLEARRIAADARVELDPPSLVPWTRKAHELHLFAAERGAGDVARLAVFEAYFIHGTDIGRVDELVRLATAVGLDGSESTVALGVDRLEAEVLAARREATALGVSNVPAIIIDGELIEGFRNQSDLGTLLGASRSGQ